jgi:uncharacterized protein (DUF302 family)
MTMRSFDTTVTMSLAAAEEAVRAALGRQGFGVLTEIDVAATLKAKLGVERAPLKILGACNPALANRALELDPAVALLLPCNVVVDGADGAAHVSVADPHDLMDDARFTALADEAAQKLRAAIDDVTAAAPAGAKS